MLRLLLLCRYDQQGASSRLRCLQYQPWLESAGIDFDVSAFFDGAMLLRKYKRGSYSFWDTLAAYTRRIRILMGRDCFDLLWIEKECLPWLPVYFEQLLLRGRPYMLDLDDAVFHSYDLHRSSVLRYFLGKRIDCLMAGARLVVGGNEYLAARAKAAGAPWVEVLPTVVDITRYISKSEYEVGGPPRIVWVGSPSTAKYLLDLAKPLADLRRRCAYVLRVIGMGNVALPGVDVEMFQWSADSEAVSIAECDVGLMPLREGPWEKGKCAYKLIQYMACGLPTVSSPVGANRDVVIDGETGYFAESPSAWVEHLNRLLCDPGLRQKFGRAGRARVESEFSLQQAGPRLVGLLQSAGQQ